jgi:hypothetical protein
LYNAKHYRRRTMARQRKQARSLYLELRALDLDLYAKEDPEDSTGYRLVLEDLCSLPEAHKDRLVQRAEVNKPGLLKVLLNQWDPHLEAVLKEGHAA